MSGERHECFRCLFEKILEAHSVSASGRAFELFIFPRNAGKGALNMRYDTRQAVRGIGNSIVHLLKAGIRKLS